MNKKKLSVLMFLMNESIGGTATYLFTLMKFMDWERFDIQILCNNPEFCKQARVHGFTAHLLQKGGRGMYWKAIKYIMKLIKENRIDILNIHDGGAISFMGRTAAVLTGTLTVSTVHICAGEWGNKGVLFDLKEKFFERFSRFVVSRFIAISQARKNELLAKGIKEDKVSVIYNGIDFASFQTQSKGEFRKELSIHETVPLIAIVAHLGKEKGHKFFIQAAKIIILKHPESRFVIVGEGYLKGELIDQAESLELKENIVFTGFRKDVGTIMHDIDILVLPSVNEGLGLVILEAMISSKPVVASRVGGIPEVIVDGKTGSLVTPASSEELAQAIIRLIENKEDAERMGMAGYERVKKLFSAQRMAREMEDCFERELKTCSKSLNRLQMP